MKNPWENKFTHGIFIGFVGFVPRGALKAFTVFILKFIFNYIADPPQ